MRTAIFFSNCENCNARQGSRRHSGRNLSLRNFLIEYKKKFYFALQERPFPDFSLDFESPPGKVVYTIHIFVYDYFQRKYVPSPPPSNFFIRTRYTLLLVESVKRYNFSKGASFKVEKRNLLTYLLIEEVAEWADNKNCRRIDRGTGGRVEDGI